MIGYLNFPKLLQMLLKLRQASRSGECICIILVEALRLQREFDRLESIQKHLIPML